MILNRLLVAGGLGSLVSLSLAVDLRAQPAAATPSATPKAAPRADAAQAAGRAPVGGAGEAQGAAKPDAAPAAGAGQGGAGQAGAGQAGAGQAGAGGAKAGTQAGVGQPGAGQAQAVPPAAAGAPAGALPPAEGNAPAGAGEASVPSEPANAAAPAEPPATAAQPAAAGGALEPLGGPLAPAGTASAAPAASESDAAPARLDYSDGSFYLRSVDDNIVLVPSGRMHIDTYSFAGTKVSEYHRSNGTGLKTNLFFRRFVIELGGMVRKQWFFWVGGNFAPTAVDAGQNSISTANVYDGFIGYMPTAHLRIYAGQYNAPYTMENVTSSRWLDMMERPLVVRTVAAPYNKADGLTVWGETANNLFEYQAGVFGGDGMNRPNVDNHFDGMARVLVRPLAESQGPENRLHIGGGVRYGRRDDQFVRYDAPGLSTPGGYAFWSPSYGKDAQETHIMPSGAQSSFAGELYVPFERFDLKGEVVYVSEGRREALASDRTQTLRKGTFSGVGGYAQLSWWPLGTPRVNGNPAGYYGVTKLPKDLGKQAPYGLQLVGRAEWMRLGYNDHDRRGSAAASGLSATTTDITVNAWQAAVNYWATKHVRLTAEYSLYQFPEVGKNQAVAPGRKADKTSDAEALHEVSFRVGLAL